MPAPLTRDRIVEAAIGLADRDGFEAVTLRHLARALGVHVTSLYNHVADREVIEDGMVERLIEEAHLPEAPAGWEEWVRDFFAGIGAVASAHPGAFSVLQRRPVQGARAATSFEAALAAFARAGFEPAAAYGAVKATSLVTLSVGLERSMLSQGQLPQTAVEELPAELFPQVRGIRDVTDPEVSWSFALETLIAGLRAQLRRARSGR